MGVASSSVKPENDLPPDRWGCLPRPESGGLPTPPPVTEAPSSTARSMEWTRAPYTSYESVDFFEWAGNTATGTFAGICYGAARALNTDPNSYADGTKP